MNRIVNFLQKYFAVISVLIGISILLSVTFSSYIVTSNNHKAAEMYIGELKYSIELNGSSTNTLTVPTGETIVDVKVNNLNPVDTYYKLLYLKNTNITVKYYESTKDTNDVVTTYNKPNDSITSSNSNIVKLLITNSSTSSQNIAFTMKGGYITNTIQDIITPSTYSEITLVETPSTNTYFCTTTNTLTQGLKYVNGQYTYAYKQEGKNSSSLSWRNITTDGWGVQLTDRTSTDAVTSSLCTYINNKPISSMSNMFVYSQATSIDLSNFNTSKVTNMSAMFYKSQATTLDLSSFDTSNVTLMDFMFAYSQATTLDVSKLNTSIVKNMSHMFIDSQATTLDLSNFDTSNVTNMYSMFEGSQATTLDVSNFDTSKVTDMGMMFLKSQATTIDVSSFDTSNVTNMSSMFSNSQATTLDLSNFNTSNVTNMSDMFHYSQATTIDVSNFDTSKVTNMSYMFWNSKSTMLDVSNFNTSNVTNMSDMFYYSQTTTLDVSNFNTSNVTNMSYMFYYSQATTLDVSNFDTSKVTNMSYMFSGSKATTLDLNNFDTSKVTDMSYMFNRATNLKTIYSSDKFNTDNVTTSTNMFLSSTNLVGGSGTKYNSSHIDKTYARIDGGTSNPGYFTDITDVPNSFSTDSWKTIIKAVKNNNISKYNVGDTKAIDMGSYGTHTLRVANMSTPSECSTSRFSQTACGFVLEFADIITTHTMNDTDTNVGGWPATSMRIFVNNDIYNLLPSDLKNGIIDTTVVSSYGSEDSSNFTSTDKLYLLSPTEIWSDWKSNSGSNYDPARDVTRQLDYYKNEGVTTSNYSKAIKFYNSTDDWWWLRSARSIVDYSFYNVYYYGGWSYDSATDTYGVSPAFRIG
jgi:surface protein